MSSLETQRSRDMFGLVLSAWFIYLGKYGKFKVSEKHFHLKHMPIGG